MQKKSTQKQIEVLKTFKNEKQKFLNKDGSIFLFFELFLCLFFSFCSPFFFKKIENEVRKKSKKKHKNFKNIFLNFIAMHFLTFSFNGTIKNFLFLFYE
jgi:hypothetical protein